MEGLRLLPLNPGTFRDTPQGVLVQHGPTSLALAFVLGCTSSSGTSPSRTPRPYTSAGSVAPPASEPGKCGASGSMTVHFYDVGQALAALVDLPDGRHVLVDTGDNPHRSECDDCVANHAHLMEKLRADLAKASIDLLWITHQHSDHIGGASDVLETFHVWRLRRQRARCRQGGGSPSARGSEQDGHSPSNRRPRAPRAAHGTTETSSLRPIVPPAWPASCAHDENECSIGLRIDFCSSSVLFTGDAEHEEEARLDPHGEAMLLQVGHHGSETSTSPRFLGRAPDLRRDLGRKAGRRA